MPKRKIRHALVQYVITEGGNTRTETAFRNQIVDIPKDQVERFDALRATVLPDADLDRPGTMSTLSETAGDSEILNWVMGATDAEVTALAEERPVMADRIEAARVAVKERFEEQNVHLGGDPTPAVEDDLIGIGPQDKTPAAPTSGDSKALPDDKADAVVTGKAPEVAIYIAENPQFAGAIVEAEGRRAASAKDDVRVTITRAAQAAAGFATQ
jgi:hypothetical protein